MTSRAKRIAAVAFLVLLTAVASLVFRERRLIAACQPVPEAEQAQYRLALDFFQQANKAFSTRNYSTANDLFDMAASKLGNAYRVDLAGGEVEFDDTGMALEAGRSAAGRSEFEIAAQIKQGAMRSRLAMFDRKQHLSERCHGVLAKISL